MREEVPLGYTEQHSRPYVGSKQCGTIHTMRVLKQGKKKGSTGICFGILCLFTSSDRDSVEIPPENPTIHQKGSRLLTNPSTTIRPRKNFSRASYGVRI